MPNLLPVRVTTEPVLAVLVCHDGEPWLPATLAALRDGSPRPRHILAVDTGSTDGTPRLLEAAAAGPDAVLDGIIPVDRTTGFGAAVAAAVAAAITRWGDPGPWIWLLHDDSAPEPDCLGVLLTAGELSPSAAVLGPLALDWTDPRLVVELGLSTDASGHRQTGVGPTELDWNRFAAAGGTDQNAEVLAVGSAGALVRRAVWAELGGYDPTLPMLRDDLDFGWRVNRSGRVALFVPAARLRHARAATRGMRAADAIGGPVAAVDRAHGLRTLLVNRTTVGFLIGLPRLVLLCLLRALGLVALRNLAGASAELGAVGYLLGGRAGLRAARAARRSAGQAGPVRGLLTTRTTRLRNLLRGGAVDLVRRRVTADAALGRLPPTPERPPPSRAAPRPVGPDALPAGALGRRRARSRRVAGLRHPAAAVAVPLAGPAPPRPSPMRRDAVRPAGGELMLVEIGRGRLAAQLLLAPPVLLFAGLLLVAIVTQAGRFGPHLAGGGLLPVQDLGATWSDYLASWHPVAGGTSAPAPATLAVIGGLGAVLGGPPVAVAVLLLADAPLAGVLAYVATRRMPVRRWVRALAAAAYAVLPPATAAIAQGRLDVVVVHILLPPVLAGVVAVLGPSGRAAASWLSAAAGTALGLAVIGAFAPLVHALVVVFALVGFVVVPGAPGNTRRRVVALFTVVLVPLALLVPWPAVVLAHPGVLLSGVDGGAPVAPFSVARLAVLDPGGPGASAVAGVLVLLAVVVAVVLRPDRAMLPGLVVVVLGGLGVGLVATARVAPLTGASPRVFWAGAPMVVAGCGLLWVLLGACRTGPRLPHGAVARLLAGLGAAAVLGLAAGAAVAGRAGPLRADGGPVLVEALRNELADTGRSVLVLATPGEPPRQAGGRMPAFGDGDLAAVPGSAQRLARWEDALVSGDPARTRLAVAQAAMDGVLFVVFPDRAATDRFAPAAGNLAAQVPPASDGRPVVRLQPASGAAMLISADLARQAVTGGDPPTVLGATGISPVNARAPDVALRVSEGGLGRLLVLAAADEDGWRATVDGQPAPIVRAWGHQVAVSVPMPAADVRIDQPSTLRDALLLVQAAVFLFTVLTALPTRR